MSTPEDFTYGVECMHTDVYAMLVIHETMIMEHVFRAQSERTRVSGSLLPLIAQIV